MRPMKLSQREMLRRLLDSGKLTPSETEAARKMHDDLTAGRVGGLNDQQSAWADQLCRKCGISMHEAKPGDSKKKAQEEKKRQLAEFDAMPRPKRPPGK